MTWDELMFDVEFEKIRKKVQNFTRPATNEQPDKHSVEFNDGFVSPEFFSSETALFYCSYKLVIDVNDVDEIRAKYVKAISLDGPETHQSTIAFLFDILNFRLDNYQRPPKNKIVSLGEDCLPRTLTTRWGYKPPKSLGELTCPFDLSVHPTTSLAEILNSNFEFYLSDEDVLFDRQLNHPVHNRYKILWNHEVGEGWTSNNNENLKSTYERRIRSFYALLDTENPIAFLYISKDIPAQIVESVADNIYKLSGGRGRLAVLTSHKTSELAVGEFLLKKTHTFHMHEPVPYEWYLWWFHKHFTLPLGHAWERKVVNWFEHIITR